MTTQENKKTKTLKETLNEVAMSLMVVSFVIALFVPPFVYVSGIALLVMIATFEPEDDESIYLG